MSQLRETKGAAVNDTISAVQFAKELGVTRETEWRRRQKGLLPEHQVVQIKGRRYIRYSREVVDAWLRESK